MKILIQNYYFQKTPTFNAKKINITAEQILALRAQGKKETEIPKLCTYYKKLKQLGLSTVISAYKEKLEQIPREEFENMLKNNVSIEDICTRFNLTTNAYYNYINRYDLRSYIVGANRKAVTKQKLQELVDKKISVDEICEQLQIGKDAYYELLQKFNITTDYKNQKQIIEKISKEQIESLLNSRKSYSEIAAELKISLSTLRRFINDFEINTKILQTKRITSSITKEQLQELVDSGKSNTEICKELNIPICTYTQLTHQYGIMTNYRQAKKNIASITQEMLQQLVDEGLSREEICKRLKLSSEATFYKLLKRLHINYQYKNHANEINISKEDLQKVVQEWNSADDIQDKLKISTTAFYEKAKTANVKTVMSDSLSKIKELDIQKIQEMLDNGVKWQEICEIYDIVPNIYHALVSHHGLISSDKQQRIHVSNITKEQLEKLIASGNTTKDICRELNISIKTYMRLLKKFDIKRNS